MITTTIIIPAKKTGRKTCHDNTCREKNKEEKPEKLEKSK